MAKAKYIKKIKTVPNQRIIKINKELGNKTKLYTANVLLNLNDAMNRLQGKASFKLYMYLAQNQNNYEMALSSKDFIECANCGLTAYNTAFNELVKQGYLVQDKMQNNKYFFYDKATKDKEQVEKEDNIVIPEQEVIEINITREELYGKYAKGFKF